MDRPDHVFVVCEDQGAGGTESVIVVGGIQANPTALSRTVHGVSGKPATTRGTNLQREAKEPDGSDLRPDEMAV